MNQGKQSDTVARLAREMRLLAYFEALEVGDLDAQGALLTASGDDDEFLTGVWEIHQGLAEEAEAARTTATASAGIAEADTVRDLARLSLESPVVATRAEALALQAEREAEDEEDAPATLTVRDVAHGLRAAAVGSLLPRPRREETRAAADRLASAAPDTPLEADHFTERGVRTLLDRLGLGGAGAWFTRLFHETALGLQMNREQTHFEMVAARRQHRRRNAMTTPDGETPTGELAPEPPAGAPGEETP